MSSSNTTTPSFYYINQPVVPMREEPTTQSKMCSQALFSEEIKLKKVILDWSYIETSDGYEGWIDSKAVTHCQANYKTNLTVSRHAAHVYELNDTEFGPLLTLPYGTKLQELSPHDARWLKIRLVNGKECFIQQGDVAAEPKITQLSELVPFSQKFQGLPYTWGGRSSFGYDCSGFVQMLFSKVHIHLPRDSKQQILDPHLQTIPIQELRSGDLLFFGKSAECILHVGMAINNTQFIHATVRECQPWIRISHLSDFEWTGNSEAYYCFRTAKRFNI